MKGEKMKPIIIEVRDNKINMDVSKFKKYIEDAYQQGYKDGGSVITTGPQDRFWWRDLPITPLNDVVYSDLTTTTTNTTR
jgi:hypothetical protein